MYEELFSMFTKTSAIKRAYKKHCKKPDAKPYSIQDYIFVIEKYAKMKIVVLEVNAGVKWEPKCFKGQLFKKENEADIVVPTIAALKGLGVTLCERNFAVMKEASHLLIDHDSNQVESISSMIKSIISVGANIVLNNQSDVIKSEYIGELAALELLFPFELRDGYKADVDSGVKSTLDIAKEFMIPENQVIKALSDAVFPALKAYRDDWSELLDEIVYGLEVVDIKLSE